MLIAMPAAPLTGFRLYKSSYKHSDHTQMVMEDLA